MTFDRRLDSFFLFPKRPLFKNPNRTPSLFIATTPSSLLFILLLCWATTHGIILFNIYEQEFQFYHGIIFEW
jgi:hypothetical protein